MKQKRFGRALTTVGLGLCIVHYAGADDFPGAAGPSGSGFLVATDGPFVTSCWNDSGSLPAELGDHINYINGTVGTQTDLVVDVDDCDTTTTDMLFDDNLTSGTLLGLATCLEIGGDLANNATSTNVECERWQIQINPSKISASCGSSSVYRRASWCHETGHGLGLGHETSCMFNGCTLSTTYSDHHIDVHLDSL